MEELHLDHTHLTKVFNILDQQVELIANNGDPDLFLMADIAHYIQNYPDLIHHPKEDIVFNVFKKRASKGLDIVEQLQADHQSLPNETKELYEILKTTANSTSLVSRKELKSKIIHFLKIERKHMNLEEEVLFPLIKETLTEEDWDSIDAASEKQSDPLFGEHTECCYENLYKSIKSQGGIK